MKRSMVVVLFAVVLAMCAASMAVAQLTPTLLYQKNGAASGDFFGFSVASAGDVDGDGKTDFIVGAYLASPGGLNEAGSSYVYSGATGALLYQKDGAAAGDWLGFSVVASAGDVNGDGKADFIVGALNADPGGLTNAGSAYLYSGADGTLLYQKNGAVDHDILGRSVASAGDVNGDGRPDFIIGTPGSNSGGSVSLYSGATGSLLYQKDGGPNNSSLGWSVASAGDVNGDGRPDFIIGDPESNFPAGTAYVYSGATGALLYQKDAIAGDYLGYSVASAGDVNMDGRADFMVGAPLASPGGTFEAGSAYVYSGATGALLYQKDGPAVENGEFGYSVASAGDLNGDGRPDFFVSGCGNGTTAYCYSGANGSLLFQKTAGCGSSANSAGDVNRDGRDDFIIGDIGAGPGGAAYVYVLCVAAKGDMNADVGLTPADVVLMLNCVFLGTGNCDLCFADVNCDASLTPSDVVSELNAVFLGQLFPC